MPFFRSFQTEYLFVTLVLLAGIILSGALAWQQQTVWQARIDAEFKTAAADRIELITEKISSNDSVIRLVTAFHRASTSISREEFAIFTKQILSDYPYISVLEWIPHVEKDEREKYESSLPNGMTFTELKDKKLVRAATREEYFPILYAEPEDKNKHLIGYDLATDPDRLAILQKAMESRQPFVSKRLKLIRVDDSNIPGVLFYAPVYLTKKAHDENGEIEYEDLEGFIGSVIPLREMIDAAIKPLKYAGVNIIIHDLTAQNENDSLLYVRPTRLKKIPEEEIIADYKNGTSVQEQVKLEVGGREWQITVMPANGYFSNDVQRETWLIFGVGLLFTILLGLYLISRIREHERVAEEVFLRTAELSKAKRETEMILLSAHEGITGLDEQGNITFCNPTGTQLLGYTKRELIGKNHHEFLHFKKPDGTAYGRDQCPIQHILEHGRPCNVRNEVFWGKSGVPVEVEYAGSPIYEDDEIAGAVLVFRDVSERRKLERKLEQMARYDQLTGLANRNLFIEQLKNALVRAERTKQKVAVIYMDLNGFKPVNDTLGHAAGDRLLKAFAERLRTIVRESDLAARMGGDEFTILADNLSDRKECLHIITRLNNTLKQPFEIDGQDFMIGASVGIAFSPDHTTDFEELITCADSAMYEAKKDKKKEYVIYGD